MEFLTSGAGFVTGTIIPFLFVLAVVVFVHEMGHYLVGRWCGIGAEAFSIGFGPEIAGFTDRRGTRWKLSAIPLGGYVKFVGDAGATSQQDSEVLDALSEEQRRIAFHTQARWKKAATIFAGPFFNFLLTIAVFAVFFSVYGRPVLDPVVAEVTAGSAAEAAGFKPGDRFISVEGTSVTVFEDVKRIVSQRAGDELAFVVERGGQQISLQATPKPIEEKDVFGNTFTRGIIGVVNSKELGNARMVEFGPVAAVGEAVKETGFIMVTTVSFMKRLVMGREDRCQLGGPVKIAKMAGQAASQGFPLLVQLTALLSVGIGVLNLFPLLPLDGGHLLVYAIESVTRRPVPEMVLEWLFRIGFAAVLLLMGFALWNDLVAC